MERDNFEGRLKRVDWSKYETAYGAASGTNDWGSVGEQLLNLASQDDEKAMKAAHHLWCGLCHQHAFISSAALPALPFILEVLDNANETIALEILDILLGFAACSVYPIPVPDDFNDFDNDWGDRRKLLRDHFSSFKHLLDASVEEISGVAGMSEESAVRIFECLHPKEPDIWIRELRNALQQELSRFSSLTSHANEEISYFAEKIVDRLTIGQTVPDVEIEIHLKYHGNKAEHDKAEEFVFEMLAKVDGTFNGYLGSASLSPGQFTSFSIRAPKSVAHQLIESLTGAGLPAGSYAKLEDDIDVPL
ncbi:MAG: hypothetical protein QG574_3960 [Cyanobacteriota bacterium erpe_2018_sw_21hr_WHONDRS-SW48-000092_B_bin.40]|jgi:hypothetical protein|nr:hypothetical protein [Cyanobacteriota bacterium erpe_2018_sw_21hr_WHONDRS-SW48-000092_B_bin.40]